jgi:hypothetical protein
MKDQIIIQYVGFEAGVLTRDYAFDVREVASQPLQYTLTIANEAFVSGLLRYQDGAEICSLRLSRELDAHANHPPTTRFDITNTELGDYKEAHRPKTVPRPWARRES